MTGNLESEGDIRLTVKFKAIFAARSSLLGRTPHDGDIVAVEVVVRGKVKGVIRAACVKLQDTACVESEIVFEKTLGIEDGASFEGQIRRASVLPPALAVPQDSPAGTSETTNEIGQAVAFGSNPGEIDPKIVSRSQSRREREGRAPVTNSA